MQPLHLFLACLVPIVWGLNFIFVKFALHDFPPLFLSTLRFFFSCFPVIFFLKKPAISWSLLIRYGVFMFGLQFAFLFMGLAVGTPPGLASLIAQLQVFFSMIFATLFFKERPTRWQILGACIAFLGMGIAGFNVEEHGSLLGFLLIIAAAISWGYGNMVTKRLSTNVHLPSLIVWGSFVAFPPLLLLSFIIEGPATIIHSFYHVSWLTVFAVFYIVYLSTWFGYGVWSWLLHHYPVASIVPFTLLVPMVGMLGSSLIFHEPLQPWKLYAALCVVLGLSTHLFGSKLYLKYLEKIWYRHVKKAR